MEESRFFYIASSIKNVEQVRRYIDAIADFTAQWNSPYECAHDWTTEILSDTADSSIRKKALQQELSAIEDCSVVIALPPLGRGSHVEIGYAIASRIPVVMVGEKDNTCLAYEAVDVVEDLDALLEGLDVESWV